MSFVSFLLNDTSQWGSLVDAPMLGGRERATVAIAEQLAKRHFVTIFNPYPEENEKNGVSYQPLENIDKEHHQNLVAINGYDLLPGLSAQTKTCWVQTGLPKITSLLNDTDAVVVNSEAKLHYLNVPNRDLIRPPKAQIIGNGVDLAWWDGATYDRVPGRLLYSQSPDRGLHHILRWWPELKRRLPNLTLHVTYSIERIYDFQWTHELRAEMCRTIDQGQHLPGVTFLGVLSAEDYRRELKEAELYVFPCDPGNHGETFSIGCMEACASYTPILGSGDVSIDEMYGEVAHILRGPIFDQAWISDIEILMTKPWQRETLVKNARALAEQFTWTKIADQWESLLLRLAEQKAA